MAAELVALSIGGGVWLITGLLVGSGHPRAGRSPAARARGRRPRGPSFSCSRSPLSRSPEPSSAPPRSVLTSATELGNLIRPLDRLRFFGIGRLPTFGSHRAHLGPTYVLIAVLAGAAAGRAVVCLEKPSMGAARLRVDSDRSAASSWLGKGLAVDRREGDGNRFHGLPSYRARGLRGLFRAGPANRGGRGSPAAIAGGVLWSNALAYHAVWLAPEPALAELNSIGNRFAGEGPTLMTEYEPYGVRHFLRTDGPGIGKVSSGDWLIPLLDGRSVPKGGYADLDQF